MTKCIVSWMLACLSTLSTTAILFNLNLIYLNCSSHQSSVHMVLGRTEQPPVIPTWKRSQIILRSVRRPAARGFI